MRIRYRAFNSNTKAFEKWHTIKQDGDLQEFYSGLRIDLSTHKYDKNGKEIYERDIVYNKFTGETSVVYYNNRAMFILYDGYYSKPLGNFSTEDSLEIIGNYYQNEEIINKMDIYYHIADYIYGELGRSKIFLDKTAEMLSLTDSEIKEIEEEAKGYFDVKEDIKFDKTIKDFINDIYKGTGGF